MDCPQAGAEFLLYLYLTLHSRINSLLENVPI